MGACSLLGCMSCLVTVICHLTSHLRKEESGLVQSLRAHSILGRRGGGRVVRQLVTSNSQSGNRGEGKFSTRFLLCVQVMRPAMRSHHLHLRVGPSSLFNVI